MSKANRNSKSNVSLKNNDEAVSPVIGTILMVAVTVILAAVVAAFMFGLTGSMPKAPQVAYFSVERSAPEELTIAYTAPVITEVTGVEVYIDNVLVTDGNCGTGNKVLDLLDPAKGKIVITGGSTGTLTTLSAEPVKVEIKARINGASLQVIQEVNV